MKILPVLTLAVASLTLTAYAAKKPAIQSIDCKKTPLAPTETTICNTPSLLKVDSQMMADLDLTLMNSGGQQTRRPDEMSKWLAAFAAKRDWCGRDKACIQSAYKSTIDSMELSIERNRLKMRGLSP